MEKNIILVNYPSGGQHIVTEDGPTYTVMLTVWVIERLRIETALGHLGEEVPGLLEKLP